MDENRDFSPGNATERNRPDLNKILKGPPGQTREVFCVENSSGTFSLREGKPQDLNRTFSEFDVALRMLKNGMMGFSWTSDPCKILNLPAEAEKFLFPTEPWGWQIPLLTQDAAEPVEIYDGKNISRSDGEIWEELLRVEKKAKRKDSRIKKSLSVSFSAGTSRISTLSAGNIAESFIHRGERTDFSLTVALIGIDGQEVQLGGSYRTRCFFDDLDVGGIIDEAVDDTVSQFGGVSARSRKMAVLLPPVTACAFLSVISPYFCADDYLEGKVPQSWKEGAPVISPLVTIIDDGTIPRLSGSFPFDCEGVPARRHVIVDKGIFKNFLTDFRTAKLLGRKTTGNAERNARTLPHVGFFNLFIENGTTAKDVLVNDGEVFQIDEIIGTHLVNSATAQFSFGARGRLFKNGRKIKSLRGVTVSGNLIDFYRNIVGVGNDLRFYSSVGSPSLLVKDVQISGE